jgi:hypothetical protein
MQFKPFIACLLFVFSLSTQALFAQKADEFNPSKYKYMAEIDMRSLFSGNPGTGFIFRKKYENPKSRTVFVDRTKYTRFGVHLGGYTTRLSVDSVLQNTNFPQTSNNANYYFSPFIGRETMFEFGRFNLYYAVDFNITYQYLDINRTYTKSPCIANAFGTGISLSGGMRYCFHDRFSVSLQSTPFAAQLTYKKGQFYVPERVPFTEFSYSTNQIWLSSLGLTYHF